MDDGGSESILRRRERFEEFNAARLKLALRVASPDARVIIDILPMLFHYNDPMVPGYREGAVPHGIDNFKPSSRQKRWLKAITAGREDLKEPSVHSIYGLYAMGSTASIGQGVQSDFDIWVCVPHTLSEESISLLSDKCRFISAFARAYGVEVNLFITRENRFTAGYHDSLDRDNCGSAQNLFLLDEFYRSALRLCGRYLLWFFVTLPEEIDDYEAAVQRVRESGAFAANECFDFGSVVNSSPDEYFGSGLWLLYKGIDAPFKAALKILLMEAYSHDYPRSGLLSTQIREKMQHYGRYSVNTDAYYLMYKKVADYLSHIHDSERLNLVRTCFYLKIYIGLEGLVDTAVREHRREILDNFRSLWGWDQAELERLQNRDRWKIDYVRSLYTRLFSSLIQSYKALLVFSVRHGIEYAITSDDAGVLSRKLYAAFDRYAGKIIVFNAELSASLEERHLTFIHPNADSLCRQAWHMYTLPAGDPGLLNLKPAYIGDRLCELITWACFNNILTPRTLCHVAGSYGEVTPGKIRALAADITRLFKDERQAVSDDNLQRPREIKSCCVILNFEHDVTVQRNVSGIDINVGSSLSCGRQHMCLIGSVDLVLYNTWGEMRVIGLPDGEEGLVELLVTLLRISKSVEEQDLNRILKNIRVCSYAHRHRDLLRYDVEAVIRRVFNCQQTPEPAYFRIGSTTYVARATGERGVKIIRHNVFSEDDFNLSINSRYGMRPEFSMQVPPLVDRYSNIGVRQYFFAPLSDGWDIYTVNEKNEVEIYPHYVGSRAALVNAINRFYTKQSEEVPQSSLHFNLPQYFVLSSDLKSIHPFTIRNESPAD
ncbi:MAG TPA: class I adenylate cyclase [Candidatus Avisuccinivibrio pullicola]|nr:class I adenylate cyclase [Candidatus Avisuccinivibrio pullicola]